MDKCYNMDNLKKHYAKERNQSPKTIYCMTPLGYAVSKTGDSIDPEID